ncbi:MAG: DoxX family membrane protein [Candidatus Acidiferrales bacterium]
MNTDRSSPSDAAIAYLLFRFSLGFVIFLHGIVRLAWHYQQFVQSTTQSFAKTPLALGSVHFAALCIPPVEAVLGFFILIGLLTRWALVGGALLMIFLLFGKCMQQDWATVAIQLAYAFFYFVLLVSRRWNRFALDSVFRPRSEP